MKKEPHRGPRLRQEFAANLLNELEQLNRDRLVQLKEQISHGDYLASSTAVARSLVFPVETNGISSKTR